jgi:hypothetical protein
LTRERDSQQGSTSELRLKILQISL